MATIKIQCVQFIQIDRIAKYKCNDTNLDQAHNDSVPQLNHKLFSNTDPTL